MSYISSGSRHRTWQSDADPRSEPGASGVEIGLNAAIVAVADNEPVVLIIRNEPDVAGATDGLPFGPFSPLQHRTFEGGLRAWVHRQTGPRARLCRAALHVRRSRPARRARRRRAARRLHRLSGADAGEAIARHAARRLAQLVSLFPVGGLAPRTPRDSRKPRSSRACANGLAAQRASPTAQPISRQERVRICFALDGAAWDEEKVLERYELLYEAGLVEEAAARWPRCCAAMERAPAPRRADALRPSPHPRHRHRPRARQDQISPGDLRADAGRLHAVRAAADGRGDPRPAPAQAELPPPCRRARASSRRPAR